MIIHHSRGLPGSAPHLHSIHVTSRARAMLAPVMLVILMLLMLPMMRMISLLMLHALPAVVRVMMFCVAPMRVSATHDFR